MLKFITFLIFLFVLSTSENFNFVSADCNRFVPTPIWNFTEFMHSSWTISGLVDPSPPFPDMRYVEMGSSWNSYSQNTFEMWTHGTTIDNEGQELAFDGWFYAQRSDENRPGDLVTYVELGEEIYSNVTILYFDNQNILWVECFMEEGSSCRGLMGSKARTLPDSHKEQFKSILKFDYGMDVDKHYVDIPQEFTSSSPRPRHEK